jgi:LytS/YehU family sensor histidine kinase
MAERFRGQLSFEVVVEPSMETTRVPALLLQSLLEEALGPGLITALTRVRVEVRRKAAEIQYVVSTDATDYPSVPTSLGRFSKLRQQLEHHFPDRHMLAFTSQTARDRQVTLSFSASSE